ncbi:M48 family metallopeptidase [Rubidibacter lacunae]|uniref:M48 family metallopeptidase n=1 Tax=Rubidibacter lacunae TaxID=582514 RepID=UPI0006860F1D|nr:M48 family metallopeptidase [Rubidibacter lacunae]
MTAANKYALVGLRADSFQHPLDRNATRALRELPGLDFAIRNILGSVAEQFFYVTNIAASVRVSERQLPDIHKLLVEACRRLDLDLPQLYVQQHPVPNAYTFAMRGKQPFVVIHTSLLELLTPEEVQAVIAHELGHLKCEHGVYLTLVNLFVQAANLIPAWGELLSQPLKSQLLEWMRCAEFTCDRAALLAIQEPRVVMSVLMKLAGGSPTLAQRLNLDAFIEQARAYEAFGSTELGDALKIAHTQQLTHPVPVLRAREIERWARSREYDALLAPYRANYNNEAAGKWRNW